MTPGWRLISTARSTGRPISKRSRSQAPQRSATKRRTSSHSNRTPARRSRNITRPGHSCCSNARASFRRAPANRNCRTRPRFRITATLTGSSCRSSPSTRPSRTAMSYPSSPRSSRTCPSTTNFLHHANCSRSGAAPKQKNGRELLFGVEAFPAVQVIALPGHRGQKSTIIVFVDQARANRSLPPSIDEAFPLLLRTKLNQPRLRGFFLTGS